MFIPKTELDDERYSQQVHYSSNRGGLHAPEIGRSARLNQEGTCAWAAICSFELHNLDTCKWNVHLHGKEKRACGKQKAVHRARIVQLCSYQPCVIAFVRSSTICSNQPNQEGGACCGTPTMESRHIIVINKGHTACMQVHTPSDCRKLAAQSLITLPALAPLTHRFHTRPCGKECNPLKQSTQELLQPCK